MIPLFHPMLKHGAKPPAAGKGHECPSSFSVSSQISTFHSRIILEHLCRGRETLQTANQWQFIPMIDSNCELPLVIASGKQAVFHKMDAQFGTRIRFKRRYRRTQYETAVAVGGNPRLPS
jgi:hypothetical protein